MEQLALIPPPRTPNDKCRESGGRGGKPSRGAAEAANDGGAGATPSALSDRKVRAKRVLSWVSIYLL